MNIDEKIGWWVAGLPYTIVDENRAQSFKRKYIVPSSNDKKKKAEKFLKEDIVRELLECRKPHLEKYFITYHSENITEDFSNNYIVPRINGEGVYLNYVGDITSTDILYKKIEETIRKSVLPRKLAVEDIFSKDDGITAPPLHNTSSRKGTYTTVAETNFAGFNTLYREYKKFMESFDILLKEYRGDPSKQTNTRTYVMCILFAFSSTLFSFFKSEFILFSKNVVSSLGGLLLIVLRFLQFCVGLLGFILSGREIGSYISNFFMPTDKSFTGFAKALWNNIQSLSSFTLSCLSDLAFLCMTHTYLFDIDSSMDGNLRPDLPAGPYFPQNIRYVLSTLHGASGTMLNATKSIVSIFSPYVIGRAAKDTWNGIWFAGMYLTSGMTKIARKCWDKVKSTLNLNTERYASYYIENAISSLEGIVGGALDKAADDLQASIQSCKSRFQAATAILKAPGVMIALGSLLGGLIGPGVFAGMFGYIAGVFAGLGVAAPPIAMTVSVPLMIWMLECLLKLWGTICNFFFYKSCAHKNCRDTSADVSNSATPDPISEIERKLCMQKCWDSGVAGITSISIPFHVLTEMSAILNAANFQYTSSAIEGMKMMDATTQGTWREYLLGKTKTYAYDPTARSTRDYILNNLTNDTLMTVVENQWGKAGNNINLDGIQLTNKEIENVLDNLNKGSLTPTSENIAKIKKIESIITANAKIIVPISELNLMETPLLLLYENYKKENPDETFINFSYQLGKQQQDMRDIYQIKKFLKGDLTTGKDLDLEENPDIFFKRVDKLEKIMSKVRAGVDSSDEIKKEFEKLIEEDVRETNAYRTEDYNKTADRFQQLEQSCKKESVCSSSSELSKLQKEIQEMTDLQDKINSLASEQSLVIQQITSDMQNFIKDSDPKTLFIHMQDRPVSIRIDRADLLKNDWIKHRIETEQLKDEDIPSSYFMRYFKDKVKEGYVPTRDEIKFIEDTALSSRNAPFRRSLEEAYKTTVLDLLEECKKETPKPTTQDFKKYLDDLTVKAENVIFADIITDILQKKDIKMADELNITDEQRESIRRGQQFVNDSVGGFYTLLRDKKDDPQFEPEFKKWAESELASNANNVDWLLTEFKYKIEKEKRSSWNPLCRLPNASCSIYTPEEEAYIKELENKIKQIRSQRKQLDSTPAFFSLSDSSSSEKESPPKEIIPSSPNSEILEGIKNFQFDATTITEEIKHVAEEEKKKIKSETYAIPLDPVVLTGKPILALYNDYTKKYPGSSFIEFANDMRKSVDALYTLIPIEEVEDILARNNNLESKEKEDAEKLFEKMHLEREIVRFKLIEKTESLDAMIKEIDLDKKDPSITDKESLMNFLKRDEKDTIKYTDERIKTLSKIVDDIEYIGKKGTYETEKDYIEKIRKYGTDAMKYRDYQGKAETTRLNIPYILTGNEAKDKQILEDAVNKIYDGIFKKNENITAVIVDTSEDSKKKPSL